MTTEADWFTNGEQENDWARVMMIEFNLTAWKSRSDVKTSTPSTHGCRQMTEYGAFSLSL